MDKHANVIIIRPRKRVHHGHHGGAWKVAYADFVTAMMAFFLVMWIMAQSKEVKESVAGYFRDPGAFETSRGGGEGVLDGGRQAAVLSGGAEGSAGVTSEEQRALATAADRIRQELLQVSNLAELRDQIEFKLTAEGLRIDLVDQTGSSFFDSGRSALRGESAAILAVIAEEIGRLQNDVVVEGHTDSAPYGTGASYGNWELSVDRANAARRVMEEDGMGAGQVQAVRGFADTQLHLADAPLDPRNRRVSIVVRTRAAAALEASVRNSAPSAAGSTKTGSQAKAKTDDKPH